MNRKVLRRQSLALFFLALLAFGLMSGGNTSIDSNRKKAKHYFLEGAIKDAEGKEDEAYEYYKKAYLADSTYVDAGNAYGSSRLFLNTDMLSRREQKLKALKIARKYMDFYPGDAFATMQYGYMAQISDTLPEAIRVYEDFGKYNNSNISVILSKAETYGMMGMNDSAISTIRHFERIKGTSVESTLQKVRYHLLEGDTISIFNELTDLVASNPTNIDYLLLKAKVMEVLGTPDSSLYYIRLAEKFEPNDGRVKNELANYYAIQGDSISFDKYTYEALMSENLDMELKVGILSQYMQRILSDKSDTKRSDKLFETLRQQYPHEPVILELGAQYSGAKKDFPSAIEQLKYAIDLDGQNPEYYGGLMTYYLVSDLPEEAMAIYEKSKKGNVELPPSASILYANAAETLKKFDIAEATYDSLINDLAPGVHLGDSVVDLTKLRNLEWQQLYVLSSYFEMAGDMYYKMGNLDETFRCYDNTLMIFPDNILALNNYAYFLIDDKGAEPGDEDFRKAKEMSEKALHLTAKEPVSTYLDTYAWILFKEGNFEEAEKYQEQAFEVMEKEGQSPTYDFYSHYGDILFMNGKPEEALEQWEKALELEPDDAVLQKKVQNKSMLYEEENVTDTQK